LLWETYYSRDIPPAKLGKSHSGGEIFFKSLPQYKTLAQFVLGMSVLYLYGMISGPIIFLKEQWPHMFSFAEETELFHLPLSVEAYNEFLEFQLLQKFS
jgi:hypothetical protein